MPKLTAECCPSNHHRLQNREIPAGIDLALQSEATRLQQLFKFFPGALPPGDESHHVDVENFDEIGFRIVANNRLNQKQLGVRWRGAAQVFQNPGRFLIAPIVDDIHHHVGIAGGHVVLKEISTLKTKAVGSYSLSLLDYVRQIK